MAFSSAGPLVALVGAGPGNPRLLTLRAVECLAGADLVLYDLSVPCSCWTMPLLTRIAFVSTIGQTSPGRIPHIHRLMLDSARRVARRSAQGRRSPLFGRGGEEAEVLHAAGIPFEIVPGVTAAAGAAAYAGIPLTHRLHASAVRHCHRPREADKTQPDIDWAALACFPGTLVVYMGLAQLSWIARTLLAHGLDPQTPAAAIHAGDDWPAANGYSTLVRAARRGDTSRVAGTRPDNHWASRGVALGLAWFERQPLFGKRVSVARPHNQAADLAPPTARPRCQRRLAANVEVRDDGRSAVDRVLAELTSYQWLVFTSPTASMRLCGGYGKWGEICVRCGGLGLAVIAASRR